MPIGLIANLAATSPDGNLSRCGVSGELCTWSFGQTGPWLTTEGPGPITSCSGRQACSGQELMYWHAPRIHSYRADWAI